MTYPEATEPFKNPTRGALLIALVCLSVLRLAHVNLLWADEDYHIAAALQMLHGKLPYRDFWYDKPPLAAFYYLLVGAHAGFLLRSLDAAYVLATCAVALRFAARLWDNASGWAAAVVLAFYFVFYLPSAVIPFAADALMLLPHLLAVDSASGRRPFRAGVWSGIAFLANTKAVFVLAACAVWLFPEKLKTRTVLLLAGFAAVLVPSAVLLVALGGWPGYIQQVWQWSLVYARLSPVVHPWHVGLSRTADWLGFHAAAFISAVCALRSLPRASRWRFGAWIALSFAAACLGTRFAPHYFLQLLPPLLLLAGRGVAVALRDRRKVLLAAICVAAVVPLIRFGPRYAMLAYDSFRGVRPDWRDVAMDLDSQDAALFVNGHSHPADTLFVWGYRPNVYVYTRLIPPGFFWDSQPLTGVPADRHLSTTSPIYAGPAVTNRRQLAGTAPVWIVDGLTLLNPGLRPDAYPELRDWFSQYRLVARTKFSLVYQKMTEARR